MSKKWKVAVIGCGMFANSQYFPYISSVANAECVAAVDIVVERAKAAAEKYNIPNYYKDVYELIEKCDFDIVIDSASIPAHHEINMAVLNAKKHLISQKPAALSVEDMTEQIECAKKNGVMYTAVPIHAMRPDILRAKQMIKAGAIGDVLSIKCVSTHGGPEYFQYRDVDPTWFFQKDAGALVDMGVHALHQVTAIMGPAKRVSCMAATSMKKRTVRSGKYDGKEITTDIMPDNYYITLDFGDGKIGFVDTGFCERATRSVPLEVFGSLGTISFDQPGTKWPDPKLYVDSPERGFRGWVEQMSWIEPPKRIFNQCCPLTDMTDALENVTQPILTPEHHRHVIEIMAKINEAIKTGNAVELTTTF
ncbi:MAG: Gfo/Idh/MocA family oxidoreductase [Ruminococcaceae bacterium]|nr:Gfo/Idh/MocA family oxidoreductase [Oscillospiraceae bacterium]